MEFEVVDAGGLVDVLEFGFDGLVWWVVDLEAELVMVVLVEDVWSSGVGAGVAVVAGCGRGGAAIGHRTLGSRIRHSFNDGLEGCFGGEGV